VSRLTDIQADLASRTGLNDVEAAAELSALTVAAVVDVPTKSVRRYLVLEGKLGGIEIAARGTDALAAVCRMILQVLEPGAFDDLDYNDPEVVAKITSMCDVLVSGGLISSANKTAILAMGNQMVLKYNQSVHHLEVASVRKGV
jgi:hypothetical protein